MKWDLFCTASEPTPTLLAYIAHHLQQGANHIWMFMETPDPDLSEIVADLDRVTLIPAGRADWPELHGREFGGPLTSRQIANGRIVKHLSQADWIGHLDVDEFAVHIPSVMAFVAKQPDHIYCVHMHNAERVELRGSRPKHIYSGWLRTPFINVEHPAVQAIHGEWSGFLRRGVAGYAIGKCFFRVKSDFDYGIHSLQNKEPGSAKPHIANYQAVGVVHFDGFTAKHWLDKMTRKSDKGRTNHPAVRERQNQVRQLWEIGDDQKKRRELFRRVKTLSLWQMLRLRRWRRVHRMVCDVPAALKAQFPDLTVDLSPAAIDKALADHIQMRAKTEAEFEERKRQKGRTEAAE